MRRNSQRGLTPRSAPDPLRQAVLPVWRAGLCCTTRASRPASAVGVSSNVRPRKPNAKTATPSRFGARSVIEQLHQRSLSGIAQSCKEAREQSHARDAPPRSEDRPGGRSNQQPQPLSKHRRPCQVAHGTHEHEHDHERVSMLQACRTRGHGSEHTSPRLPTVAIEKPARHPCGRSREA
jgi:hypothetical protein